MSDYTPILSCRLCGCEELESFFDLGWTPLANDLVEPGQPNKGEFPLEIVVCQHCNSHQLRHNVSPEVLFSDYLYSTPPALKPHFEKFTLEVTEKVGISHPMKVLDIGGNNGTLIECFQKLGIQGVNVEPSSVYKESAAKGIKTYHEFFSSEFAEKLKNEQGQFDLIVSANVFAHSPTVADMFKGVKTLLKPNGHFVMENAYLVNTLKNKDLGQFYHEHFFYHSLSPLLSLGNRTGVVPVEVTFNNAQCGSFRLYFKNEDLWDFAITSNLYNALIEDIKFRQSDEYRNFKGRVEETKKWITAYLEANKSSKIAIFGVTAKLATIIKYFGIVDYFAYAVDEAPLKQGKVVPGTNIQIYSPDKLTQDKPDTVFIGAYNFADSIVERFKSLDVTWVTPLPEFKIYVRN